MKINPVPFLVPRSLGVVGLLAFPVIRRAADTLTADPAVFVQSDPKSPVLTRLKAGSTVTVVGVAPAGWRRVEVAGPFEVYVHNRDITKVLEVREGASIYAAPSKSAHLLPTPPPCHQTQAI